MSKATPKVERDGTYVRWMICRDMPEVLQIERASYQTYWTEDDFKRELRERDVIGQVAERGEMIAGFMVYRLHKTHLEIIKLAVDVIYRRSKVGSTLVSKLVAKLGTGRRRKLLVEVHEANLPAQLFFRAIGFKATRVLRNHYRDTEAGTTADAYRMEYSIDA